MSNDQQTRPSSPPTLGTIKLSDIWAALAAGVRDFRRAPVFGLFFGLFFVIGGIAIFYELAVQGRQYLAIPLALGFPLLAPFLAVGLYEVSRRIERGEGLEWGGIVWVVFRQKDRQIPSIAMVLIMFFMFWVFIAHLVFALFMGLQPMTNILSNWQDTLLTQNGITMLAIGTGVGGIMAFVLFCLTAFSIPMLLDREMDFITAMIHSFQLVTGNLVPMLVWAFIIAVLTILAMLPFFVGIFVVLPVLGHATWHLYRRVVSYAD